MARSLFQPEESKRMETFPSPLIQLQTWFTQSESVVSVLSCYSARSYELTGIFCPANQLASSLLSSLFKWRGCLAWRNDFSACRNREQVKLTRRLCFIITSVGNTYFTKKCRPLNSRGVQAAFTSSIPSPLTDCIFVSDSWKLVFNWKALQIQGGKHGDTSDMTKMESSRQRVVHLSMLCFAWPFVPRSELWTKSSRNQPQTKYSEGLTLKEICWTY